MGLVVSTTSQDNNNVKQIPASIHIDVLSSLWTLPCCAMDAQEITSVCKAPSFEEGNGLSSSRLLKHSDSSFFKNGRLDHIKTSRTAILYVDGEEGQQCTRPSLVHCYRIALHAVAASSPMKTEAFFSIDPLCRGEKSGKTTCLRTCNRFLETR